MLADAVLAVADAVLAVADAVLAVAVEAVAVQAAAVLTVALKLKDWWLRSSKQCLGHGLWGDDTSGCDGN